MDQIMADLDGSLKCRDKNKVNQLVSIIESI